MDDLIAELESAIDDVLTAIAGSGDRGLMDAALGALENKMEEGEAMAKDMAKQGGKGGTPAAKGKKRHKVEA